MDSLICGNNPGVSKKSVEYEQMRRTKHDDSEPH